MVIPQGEGFSTNLRIVRTGVVLALMTILLGFVLGGIFGGKEDQFRAGLAARAEAALESAYQGDRSKIKPVLDKSWAYCKRAHLHGGALGTATLAMILLIAALRRPSPKARAILAGALGVGSLGYTLYWLLTGLLAPGKGSVTTAKETLAILAIPSSGALLLGTVTTLVWTVIDLFSPSLALATRAEETASNQGDPPTNDRE